MTGLYIAMSSIPIEGHTGCKHLRAIGSCNPLFGLEGCENVCLHLAWPHNRYGESAPLAHCAGDIAKCDIPQKLLKRYRNGLKARVRNAQAKLIKAEQNLDEFNKEGLLR